MDIHMWNISYTARRNDVKTTIANILHSSEYARYSSSNLPMNLEVRLRPDRRGMNIHRGVGTLTLPTVEVGSKFLADFGGQNPRRTIVIGGRTIRLQASTKPLQSDIVGSITHLPYLDPRAVEENQARESQLGATTVHVSSIQFGWECRDEVFSSEWSRSVDPQSKLFFDDDRRAFRIVFGAQSISFRISQILLTAAATAGRLPIVYFSLSSTPNFELDAPDKEHPILRTRISYLDEDHARVVQYASLALRLVCTQVTDLESFRSLCRLVNMSPPLDDVWPTECRNLFSVSVLQTYNKWLELLSFEVAFQVEAITRKLLMDLGEMLSLRPQIDHLERMRGVKYLTGLLRHFSTRLKDALDEGLSDQSVLQCFERCKKDYVPQPTPLMQLALEDTFDCLHVELTPTTMKLDGPFPERSNRVFRSYPNNHSFFVRVAFVDETSLQLRFDREIDGASFVRNRVGAALKEGITIGGRLHRFLAYSQSALKEHAVWVMRPFYDDQHRLVDTHAIISSLGNFGVDFDPKLMFCPGRYGARISQAFTTTDSSITVEPDEIFPIDDVKRPKDPNNESEGSWVFTDGVGTISSELAQEIWNALRDKRRRARRSSTYPRCYQIRLMGCKGMLSVDYKLEGRAICYRQSMSKFEAPESLAVEIARAFDRPSPYYLNRPLITVLSGLGVEYDTFKFYQDMAVREAQDASKDLERASRMLESFGLSASYRLPSIMLHLHKLGVKMPTESFYHNMMEFATNHVLRELKHHARIPIPGWTLVGVVDVHGFLEADQVFACVQDFNGRKTYIDGRVVVTRSPVIHPGDVQMVTAIGQPPEGSPFAMEPLANSIVFSIKGDRPLPSMLGGGDCDGDTFNITPLENLPVKKRHPPAAYTDAPKKTLPHPCTMDDVADFIVEYINSDVLGLVAINWLIIADQSEEGIFDEDCEILAQLHSDAVDYPKSSTPVPLNKIPRLKFKEKPDWNRPETLAGEDAKYYQSESAIGKLFRAIELPALHTVQRVSRTQRRHLRDDDSSVLDRLGYMNLEDITEDIDRAVCDRITEFIGEPTIDDGYLLHCSELFDKYASQLRSISASHTLSYSRDAMLTEEEVVVGTIVAKSSQPRRRKDLMSKLREQTALLVKAIRNDLAGDDDTPLEATLKRAWTCWRLTSAETDTFGARSLGIIALGCIFDTIKAIENEESHWL